MPLMKRDKKSLPRHDAAQDIPNLAPALDQQRQDYHDEKTNPDERDHEVNVPRLAVLAHCHQR